jgi:large subunit ribosomal protein L25
MAASISVAPRSERGKGAARSLRRQGRIPAVMYGHGDETRELSLDAHDLERLLSSINVGNTLIQVEFEGGESTRALIREVQWNPYRPLVLHVDFYQVHAGEPIKLDVPVVLNGTPAGVRDNSGVLQQSLYALHIECLPRHIPETVEVDVSGLSIGDSVSVREISLPNVTIHNDGDLAICSVTGPTVAALPEAEEEVVPEEGADVEPEVIRRRGEDADDVPTQEQGD